MQKDHVIENSNLVLVDRRKHLRAAFPYPVEFTLFTQKKQGQLFVGFLRDICLGGAGLQFEDPYGRFNTEEAEDAGIKLVVRIPRENNVIIPAHIEWAKKPAAPSQKKMGVSFKHPDAKDLMVIKKLIGLKNKDHNMMWNLWEQYDQSSA